MREFYSMLIQIYLSLGEQLAEEKAEFRHYLVLFDGFIVLLNRIEADFLVILLKSSDVLPSLGELSFLHALADVPVKAKNHKGNVLFSEEQTKIIFGASS